MEIFEVSADVHALIADLLPIVNPAARFEPGLARVVLPVGRFEPSASTWTVLERCARREPAAWPRLVEEWLREVGDRAVLAIADIELLGDVRELLRLRMVPKLSAAEREGLVTLSAGEHFDAVVVIDHPEFGGPLTTARASLLGLRNLGYVVPNTHERELADVQVHDQLLTTSEQVRVVTKPGSRYVSALLTERDRFLPDARPDERLATRPDEGLRACPDGRVDGGADRALLGLPSHSTMLLCPVTSAATGRVGPTFAGVVRDMHAASDDPCSPEVFWWRRGQALVRFDPVAGSRPDGSAASPGKAPARRRRFPRRRR